MSSLVTKSPPVSPRRGLTTRQAATVHSLLVTALEEIRDVGYDGLTVRRVAKRAGVAPATAYNYFASKDHLITEVFWRRLIALPDQPVDRRRSAANRLAVVLEPMAASIAEEPQLAAACSTAMLGSDADVARLRLKVGQEMRRRVAVALGDDADETVLRAIDLLISGALVTAGMGHLDYADVPGLLCELSTLVVRGTP